MSRILVGYTTNAGSTVEVAETIASELKQGGHSVEVKPLSNDLTAKDFDAVVIGAPMILGWHETAGNFLKKHEEELSGKKVALFACALKLTRNPAAKLDSIPLTLDDKLAADPQIQGKLQFKERFTTVDHYVNPMIAAAPTLKPISIAFFGGKLDMSRINIFQKAFVRFIVNATPGDIRNWDFIKSWSKMLSQELAG